MEDGIVLGARHLILFTSDSNIYITFQEFIQVWLL